MTGLVVSSVILLLIAGAGIVLLFRMMSAVMAFLASAVLLVALGVVAVVLVPNFINLESYKPQLLKAAREATGREIAIGGPIGFSVWPVLGLELKDISVGNPDGVTPPVMLAASELQAGVSVASLFGGTLEVQKLRLVKAQINLSTDKNGKGNWVLSTAKKPEPEEKAEQKKESAETSSLALSDMKIEKVEIVDSSLIFEPHGGKDLELEHINLGFAMPSLDEAAKLTASTVYQGQKISAVVNLDAPRSVMDGKDATLLFSADVGGNATLTFDGTLKGTSAKGKINTEVKDIPDLLTALSGTKADLPAKKLTLSGTLDASPADVALNGLKLALDDTTATGSLSAALKGAKPKLVADLDISPINLDELLPAASDSASSSNKGEGAAAAEKAPSLAPLNSADAEITARLAGITGKGMDLGATTAKVSLRSGQLAASITPATLFGGSVEAKVGVSAPKQSFTLSSTLKDIAIDKLLMATAKSDKLSGHGNLSLSLAGPVGTTAQIKSGLSGSGAMSLQNGALKGVNLAALVRQAKDALTGGLTAAPTTASDDSNKTDFTELSGTFTISNGVVSNNDLKMLSPLVRVAGKGTASLPQSSVDYRVETALVADLSGQGGTFDKKGVVIPVFVRGPFSALRYEPDLQGLVLGNLGKDPVGAVKDIGAQLKGKNLKEGAKGMMEGLLGGKTSTNTAPADGQTAPEPSTTTNTAPEAKPTDPAAALKGLFGK